MSRSANDPIPVLGQVVAYESTERRAERAEVEVQRLRRELKHRRQAKTIVARYLNLGGSIALIEALADQFEVLAIGARGGRGSELIQIEYPVANGTPLIPCMVERKALTPKE
jgi:hypothetical protein